MEAAENEEIEWLSQFRSDYEHRQSLVAIDWDRICSVLEKGSNLVACELVLCIEFQYPDSAAIRYEEKTPIENVLIPWLANYLQNGERRVRVLHINELHEHFKKILHI